MRTRDSGTDILPVSAGSLHYEFPQLKAKLGWRSISPAMKLDTEFCKLPVVFEAEKLQEEIAQFSPTDWQPHPQKLSEKFSLPLISVGGKLTGDDSVIGAMSPTPYLERCPYLQQILAAMRTVFGRTRLIQISDNKTERVETNYYYLQRVAIHFPILTFPEVQLVCGGKSLHMAAGEVWGFDTWKSHNFINPTDKEAIHLVADTVGSPFLWDLISLSEQPFNSNHKGTDEKLEIPDNSQQVVKLEVEKVNFPLVMSPWEQKCLISLLFEEFPQMKDCPPETASKLENLLARFCRQWQSLWCQYGTDAAGWDAYRQALQQLQANLTPLEGQLLLPNGIDGVEYLKQAIIEAGLHPELASPPVAAGPATQSKQETSPAGPTQSSPAMTATPSPASSTEFGTNSPESPLRSIHTSNFPQLLQQLGISLIVSTYQAGKLILVRADGDVINTHFRIYQKPMGIAASREKIAVGTGSQIWELHNIPAVTAKLDPPNRHDACYLPRNIHITGDIDIHEMNWGEGGLWFINTRFCCLCTLDQHYSFVPRWRPKFISALSPEDRCHLNGLGMVGERPKYVTALGTADTPGGWRENKARGGILIDIESNEEIIGGLSMPHSPRWYRDRLWVLESGNGSLAAVDLTSGKLETVVQLPGFTRGFDFWGPLAFIGLSQVRETAVFSGIPLTERLQERTCGVWVVNLETGEVVAFLKFEEAVQEIFAVQVLPGIRFPEILELNHELMKSSYTLPDEALADVPQGLKSAIPLPLEEKPVKKGRKRGFG